MNRATISLASLTASAAIFATGCENMSPGENAAVFGSLAGVAGGSIARAAGASTGESIAIGAVTGAVGRGDCLCHRETPGHRASAPPGGAARACLLRKTVFRTQNRAEEKEGRYIAVDTEKNEQTSPKAKKAVMIWDTQSESIVGNNVYDVEKTPAVGSAANSKPIPRNTSAPADKSAS
jgi:hypothetical protein